jgi:hypothetical protein
MANAPVAGDTKSHEASSKPVPRRIAGASRGAPTRAARPTNGVSVSARPIINSATNAKSSVVSATPDSIVSDQPIPLTTTMTAAVATAQTTSSPSRSGLPRDAAVSTATLP